MQMKNCNIPNSFLIREPEGIYERELQENWDHLPDGVVLNTIDGRRLQILSRGEWNHEAGPDFLNGKIRLDGEIIHGDIELHRKTMDYIRHGHLADSRYENVILHIVAENDMSPDTFSVLSHIPTCCVPPDSLDRQATASVCRCRMFPYMYEQQLSDFFRDAGIERLREKSKIILEDMIRSGSGFAFRKALFRAAGYKQNQETFMELQQRFESYSAEVRESHFEALLWGESMLLPDPALGKIPEENLEEAERLWNEFWDLRLKAENKIRWRRDAVRPQNTPERRIAMLCAVFRQFTLDPLPELSERLGGNSPEEFVSYMRKKLLLSDPFWDTRFSFLSRPQEKRSSVLGTERAETLLIDVIAPALLAYADVNEREELSDQVFAFYTRLGAQTNNRIFKNAMKRWFPENSEMEKVFSNAAAVQGCLHIYKTYCSQVSGDCISCLLANS